MMKWLTILVLAFPLALYLIATRKLSYVTCDPTIDCFDE